MWHSSADEALNAVAEVAVEPSDVVGIEVGAVEGPGGLKGAVVPENSARSAAEIKVGRFGWAGNGVSFVGF